MKTNGVMSHTFCLLGKITSDAVTTKTMVRIFTFNEVETNILLEHLRVMVSRVNALMHIEYLRSATKTTKPRCSDICILMEMGLDWWPSSNAKVDKLQSYWMFEVVLNKTVQEIDLYHFARDICQLSNTCWKKWKETKNRVRGKAQSISHDLASYEIPGRMECFSGTDTGP